jgi:hypothetical protein
METRGVGAHLDFVTSESAKQLPSALRLLQSTFYPGAIG